ncbi:MAG: AMP-binding protein [Ruminococcus flavefaciens]|nr:AMP-binding protein [Ruminococcus flavefaciens]
MIWDLEKYCDHVAVLDEYGTALTYGVLAREGRRVAEAVGRRCLAFLLCRNETGALVGYTGMMNAGIVPLLLNSRMDGEALAGLLDAYRPPYLWAPQDMESSFPDWTPVYRSFGYCLLRSRRETEYPLHPDLALLLTTSGSTGSPKFVRQSCTNVRSNAEAIASYLELDETERPISTLPMNYTYGLSIINSHLLAGAALLVSEKSLMQREFWAFFKQAGATSFGGVPYTYEMLDRMRFQRMDLPSLRTMTQAGGKLSPALHQKFAEGAQAAGRRFVVMYGQCEATARMGYLPPEKAVEKCGSMGIAIPGGTFRLVDADGGRITAPGVTGELVYEGPNVTLGYAERGEDLSKGDERGGVLQTGDMAKFDEEGYFYITGRKKRFLKIYGNRVNLDEVDGLVKERFPALDCASAGVDDHMYIFVTSPDQTGAVKEFLAHRTKLNPAAFQVIALEKIPKSDAGKTLYRELEAYYK